MTVLEALNKIPTDKWQLQDLQKCFLEGKTTKNGASIKFQTTPEIVLGMNRAAMVGATPPKIGMVIWVDSEAWEKVKADEQTNEKYTRFARLAEGRGSPE